MNQTNAKPVLISVVTPTHNRFEYLKQAIESVQANVVVPLDFQFEHIIHDCGSTDGTKEYFLSNLPAEQIFFVKDKKLISSTNENRTEVEPKTFEKNLIYIRSESKAPPSQARHICIEKARGQFLCVLDDDDIFLQRTLYNFAHGIQQNPTRQFFTCDFLRVDDQLRYLTSEDYYGWIFSSTHEMLQAIFDGSHFIQGNVCFSRKLYDQVGGYDPSVGMAEDLDLYVRFLIHGHLNVYLPIVSHLHRMHTSNFSIGCNRDKHHADLRAIFLRNQQQLLMMGIRMNQAE